MWGAKIRALPLSSLPALSDSLHWWSVAGVTRFPTTIVDCCSWPTSSIKKGLRFYFKGFLMDEHSYELSLAAVCQFGLVALPRSIMMNAVFPTIFVFVAGCAVCKAGAEVEDRRAVLISALRRNMVFDYISA
ncbi:unnamed protein product [Ilex paraguariensis]|uniref:Uncharacterized protein n=1 Tax=Ilex paraguariensis TaxID=185542 RepID=A0ABC8RP52_9AQUA